MKQWNSSKLVIKDITRGHRQIPNITIMKYPQFNNIDMKQN